MTPPLLGVAVRPVGAGGGRSDAFRTGHIGPRADRHFVGGGDRELVHVPGFQVRRSSGGAGADRVGPAEPGLLGGHIALGDQVVAALSGDRLPRQRDRAWSPIIPLLAPAIVAVQAAEVDHVVHCLRDKSFGGGNLVLADIARNAFQHDRGVDIYSLEICVLIH